MTLRLLEGTSSAQIRQQSHRCELCHRSFMHQKSLKRHHQSKHAARTSNCQACNRPFTRSDLLTRHFREQHCEMSRTVRCSRCGTLVCSRWLTGHWNTSRCIRRQCYRQQSLLASLACHRDPLLAVVDLWQALMTELNCHSKLCSNHTVLMKRERALHALRSSLVEEYETLPVKVHCAIGMFAACEDRIDGPKAAQFHFACLTKLERRDSRPLLCSPIELIQQAFNSIRHSAIDVLIISNLTPDSLILIRDAFPRTESYLKGRQELLPYHWLGTAAVIFSNSERSFCAPLLFSRIRNPNLWLDDCWIRGL